MMTKKKTPKIKRAKFAFILPIVALLLFAFAEPQYQYTEAEIVESNITNEVEKGEKELTIHGKVLDENTKEAIPGASVVIKGTAIGTVVDRDGTFTLIDPNPKVNAANGSLITNIVVSFVGMRTISAPVEGTCTFLMQDEVIVIDTKVPPPPPPAPKTKKQSSTPPPPPPPPPAKMKKGEKEKVVFFVVEDMPKYPGGHIELALWVQKMERKLAKEKNIEGKAKVAFTVNASGKVRDIKVVEKDNDAAAKGAYSIAKEMEDWKPGKQRGKAVPVKYLLPVELK